MPFFDHFSIIAPIYEKVISPRPNERLLSILKNDSKGLLLDAGGGTGRIAQFLGEKAERILILDASMGMLRQIKMLEHLEPICALSEHLPLPHGSVSQIIMVDALHHLYDQALAAAELWRVLRPGGRIVIEEPDIRNLAVKIVALFEKLALMRSHFLSPHQILQLFHYPNATHRIVVEGHNAWIIIDKLEGGLANPGQ